MTSRSRQLALAYIPVTVGTSGWFPFTGTRTCRDAFFVTDPAVNNWQDIPASYHNGSCGFSFADGHAEVHKWQSNASKYKVDFTYGPNMSFDAAGKRDMLWYKDRIQLIPFR